MRAGLVLVVLVVLAASAGGGGVLGGDGGVLGGDGGVLDRGASSRQDGGANGRIAVSAGARNAVVTRVVDGDTAILSGLGRSRFIGVDTPEVFGRRECFGAQASVYTKRKLAGRRIRYALGAERRDRYGRALVYIWLRDGRSFNELLVDRGYARPLAIAPNVRYAGRLEQRASEARAAGRGLWAPDACGS